MPKAVIPDTSCLIVLSNIDEIGLLKKAYKNVETTFEVAEEFNEKLPDWLKLTSPEDKLRQQIFEIQVDKGEASVMALAFERPESTVIIDDLKARKTAEPRYFGGLKITGTIGVIIKAKQRNVIRSVKPYLKRIRETDFYITDEIEKIALGKAGE